MINTAEWIVGTYFLWWASHLALERCTGLRPRIFLAEEVAAIDERIAASNRLAGKAHTARLAWRHTKSIDAQGKYRVRLLTARLCVRILWKLSLVAVTFWQLVRPGGWSQYMDLFYHMKPEAIMMPTCQIAACLVTSWYLFELPLDRRYHKLDKAVIVHHWLALLAAVAVLQGAPVPYAIWYGIVLIGLTFPVDVVRIFGIHRGADSPDLAKTISRWVYRYYVGLVAFGVLGTAWLMIRGIHTGSLSALGSAILVMSVAGWCYDDVKLAQSLRRASAFNYEDLRELTGEPVKTRPHPPHLDRASVKSS